MLEFLLKDIEKGQERQAFPRVIKHVTQLMDLCLIPFISLPAGLQIERIRNNYHGEVFYREQDISYRRDPWNITEFGRANLPHTSIFYGSLGSKQIEYIRATNVLETNKEFREKKMIKKRQIFTSGSWVTTRELRAAVFPFNFTSIRNNPTLKTINRQVVRSYNELSQHEINILKKGGKFISNNFARSAIRNHLDYTITSTISDYIFCYCPIDAILYPSVRAEYRAFNIAILPRVVDTSMKLQLSAIFELILHGKKAVIDNVADGEIKHVNRIEWKFLDRLSDRELNKKL